MPRFPILLLLAALVLPSAANASAPGKDEVFARFLFDGYVAAGVSFTQKNDPATICKYPEVGERLNDSRLDNYEIYETDGANPAQVVTLGGAPVVCVATSVPLTRVDSQDPGSDPVEMRALLRISGDDDPPFIFRGAVFNTRVEVLRGPRVSVIEDSLAIDSSNLEFGLFNEGGGRGGLSEDQVFRATNSTGFKIVPDPLAAEICRLAVLEFPTASFSGASPTVTSIARKNLARSTAANNCQGTACGEGETDHTADPLASVAEYSVTLAFFPFSTLLNSECP